MIDKYEFIKSMDEDTKDNPINDEQQYLVRRVSVQSDHIAISSITPTLHITIKDYETTEHRSGSGSKTNERGAFSYVYLLKIN